MQPLVSPDAHHVSAADGWLDLGAPNEAELELAKVSPANREHPSVLGLRWRILASRGLWAESVEFARQIVDLYPQEPDGWIHQSFALHELKRTKEAFDLLRGQAERFPAVMTIPYNLACYACQLGNLPDARHWLRKAVQSSDRTAVRSMALKDNDLEALWEEIRQWES